LTRIVSFADGFTSASAPVVAGAEQENYTLANNQALTNITGLIFSSSAYKSVFVDFEIERIGSSTYRQSGSLILSYNGTWSITFGNYQGDPIIEDVLTEDYGITLSVVGATGQVQYSSNDLPGHTSSKIKLYVVKVTV
jgi:hypothetical protein